MFDFLGCFKKLFSVIILGVRNFRVFEILEHLPYYYYASLKQQQTSKLIKWCGFIRRHRLDFLKSVCIDTNVKEKIEHITRAKCEHKIHHVALSPYSKNQFSSYHKSSH